ncbi:MAG TPA: carboxypeptidase-like regulatory domain-containing protein, partial [Candidatus Limnocylindrales bacterium]|nr:carboxypeptidase-like regulatory domain-containing protein [Candidatus Limnocylindrales bacterium]
PLRPPPAHRDPAVSAAFLSTVAARRWLAALALLAVACTAGTPTHAPAAPAAAERELAVRAIGPAGPVSGATVCVARPGRPDRCETTGDDGVARLVLATGTYQVRAEPPEGARLLPGVAAVDLAATAEVSVPLPGRSYVSGIVRDADANAVARANVCAHPAEDAAVVCERTDADGRFRIELPPSVVKLEVFGPPDGSRLLRQWAVGRVDSFEADSFDARTDDVEGVEIALRRGVTLAGVVSAAADGLPVEAAQVCTQTLSAPLPWDCALTDDRGRYALLREPDRYWVWVIPPAERGSRLVPQRYDRAATGFQSVPFPLFSDAILDVALRDGALLHGTVTAPDGSPVVLALVCADTPFPTGRICRLTGDDGSYELATRPETYVVNVWAPDGSDLVSGYWDGKRDWTEADRVVVAGERRLDIVLARGVRLTGVVRTAAGRPVEGATVNVMDARGAVVATSTDHRGVYELAAPAGAYLVDVFAPRVGELRSVVGSAVSLAGDEVGFDVVLPPAEP